MKLRAGLDPFGSHLPRGQDSALDLVRRRAPQHLLAVLDAPPNPAWTVPDPALIQSTLVGLLLHGVTRAQLQHALERIAVHGGTPPSAAEAVQAAWEHLWAHAALLPVENLQSLRVLRPLQEISADQSLALLAVVPPERFWPAAEQVLAKTRATDRPAVIAHGWLHNAPDQPSPPGAGWLWDGLEHDACRRWERPLRRLCTWTPGIRGQMEAAEMPLWDRALASCDSQRLTGLVKAFGEESLVRYEAQRGSALAAVLRARPTTKTAQSRQRAALPWLLSRTRNWAPLDAAGASLWSAWEEGVTDACERGGMEWAKTVAAWAEVGEVLMERGALGPGTTVTPLPAKVERTERFAHLWRKAREQLLEASLTSPTCATRRRRM